MLTPNTPGFSILPTWGRIAVLLPLLLAAFPAFADGAGNKVGTCMAGICLETPLTQKDIVAKYGPGRAHFVHVGTELESGTRCYYDPRQDLYIEFNFDKHQQQAVVYNSDLTEIMVSSVPMCEKKYKPKQPFPKFATEYGLTIGSTEAEVHAAMGKPADIWNMAEIEKSNLKTWSSREALMRAYRTTDYGETALHYPPAEKNSLLLNSFYISQGKVKSIHLSDSE